MRHDEDGDRKTAARFALLSPDQVREFVQRGSNWLANKHQTSDKAWDFTLDGYDPQSEKLHESLCTVGNGYFATRGAAPNRRPTKCTIRAPMQPGFTTVSSTTYRVPQSTTRVW